LSFPVASIQHTSMPTAATIRTISSTLPKINYKNWLHVKWVLFTLFRPEVIRFQKFQ
jgi:hypothetical protein